MIDDPVRPAPDEEVDTVLSELLAQAEKEPVSPRLRELARQLEAALALARSRK